MIDFILHARNHNHPRRVSFTPVARNLKQKLFGMGQASINVSIRLLCCSSSLNNQPLANIRRSDSTTEPWLSPGYSSKEMNMKTILNRARRASNRDERPIHTGQGRLISLMK